MRKIFMLAVLGVVLSGCTSGGSSSNGKLERWTTFDGNTIPLAQMGDKQATVYAIVRRLFVQRASEFYQVSLKTAVLQTVIQELIITLKSVLFRT